MALNFFQQAVSKKKLLSHMLAHNESHAEELTDIAEGLDGEVKEKVLIAKEAYKKANELLKAAVELMKEE